MGTKSEGDGRRFLTMDSGQTEIDGAYEYTNKKIEPTDWTRSTLKASRWNHFLIQTAGVPVDRTR